MVKRIVIFMLIFTLGAPLVSCTAREKHATVNSLESGEPVSYSYDTESDKATSEEIISEEIKDTVLNDTDIPQTDINDETESKPQTNSSLPLSGVRICVDAGHGKFSQGYQEVIGPGSSQTKPAFVSGTAGSYQSEAEFNLKVALKLQSLLEEQGATVFMTRTDENAVLSNIGRAELGNDNNCNIAVRIHADGSENTSRSGISMLVPAANQFITDESILRASYIAGETVLDTVIEKTGANDLGVIYRDDLTGFNWSEIPSILIECGFMTNPAEDARLADPDYQMLIAEGICQGLIEYFTQHI